MSMLCSFVNSYSKQKIDRRMSINLKDLDNKIKKLKIFRLDIGSEMYLL